MSSEVEPSEGDNVTIAVESWIVEVCVSFQHDWTNGKRVEIESVLSEAPAELREKALRRLLAIEIRCRHTLGEKPVAADYVNRFPEQAPWIAEQIGQLESMSWASEITRGGQACVNSGEWGAQSWSVPTDLPPELGRYRLDNKVGTGGFGEVWRAWDPDLERYVAIKIARPDRYDSTDDARKSFLAEARKLAALRHANIVPVYDVGSAAGRPYVVADFIEGETLMARMRRGPIPRDRAVELVADVAAALHHAHLQGIVHRDIKPANILLDRREHPYVADFGLAASEDELRREPAARLGTEIYMSPEQARYESHRTDARSDIYSLGVVLYQLLTGRPPFLGNDKSEIFDQLLHQEPRPLRTIDDTIPPELERICLKCLRQRPSDRYTTALDLAADLRRYLRASRVRARSPRTLVAGVLAAAVVGLILAMAYLAPGNSGTSLSDDPLHWRDRLGRLPIEVPWPGHGGAGSISFDKGEKALLLASSRPRLVKLGPSLQKVSQVSIGISKPDWKNLVGIFFGYRELEHDGHPCARFQLIALGETHAKDRDKLVCGRSITELDRERELHTVTNFGEYEVAYPSSRDPPRLVLEFSNDGGRMRLARVLWQGKAIPQVVVDDIDKNVPAEDWAGSWGIIVSSGTSWWYDPIIIP